MVNANVKNQQIHKAMLTRNNLHMDLNQEERVKKYDEVKKHDVLKKHDEVKKYDEVKKHDEVEEAEEVVEEEEKETFLLGEMVNN